MTSKKSDKVLQTFIDSKTIALISSNKSERASIKKFLVENGFRLNQIEAFDNFKYALEVLEEKNLEFIICEAEINEYKAETFFKEHLKTFPNRANTFFMVKTNKETHVLKSLIEEKFIEGCLVRPFLVHDAVQIIMDKISLKASKVEDSRYIDYWNLYSEIQTGSFKKLLGLIPKYRIDNPESIEAIYLEGLFYEKQNLLDEAIDRYNEILDLDPLNISALKSIFDLYVKKEKFQEIADIGKIIVETFTIHPERIISLVRALIINKDFDCIITIAKKFLSDDMEDKELEQTIAASLAVAGKSGYLKTDPDLFVEFTSLSIKHAQNNNSIIFTCLNNLMDVGHISEVKRFLETISEVEDENLLKVIDYRVEESEMDDETTFIKGAELTKSGVHEFYVYDIWLKSAVKTGKKEALIDTIVDEAVKYHPIRKNYFLSLIR